MCLRYCLVSLDFRNYIFYILFLLKLNFKFLFLVASYWHEAGPQLMEH